MATATMASQAALGYPYRPLNREREEIRLLEFSQSFDVNAPGPLRCSMAVHSMIDEERPSYSAVSWCWGDSLERETIIVDGHELSISRAAERTLRHLHDQRSPLSEHKAKLVASEKHRLWLDHICINQHDMKERAEQVRLMAAVYSRARQVLIWLGEDARFTEAAVTSIRSVLAQCHAETGDRKGLLHRIFHTGTRHLRITDEPLPPGLDMGAIQAYYTSPWFARLWIVQEAALARRAYCFSGLHCLDLMDVITAAVWMYHHQDYVAGQDDCIALLALRMNEDVDHETHEGDCRLGKCIAPMELDYCLSSVILDRFNSDPKDKVYGVLGLLDTNIAQQITVNYDLPLAQVFATGTQCAIESGQRLDILADAGLRGDRDSAWYAANDWPSWVPVFDKQRDDITDPLTFLEYLYKASLGYTATIKAAEMKHPYYLPIAGVPFDRVGWVSPVVERTFDSDWSAKDVFRAVYKVWQSYQLRCEKQHVYGSRMTTEEAVCLTMCAGLDFELTLIDEGQLATFGFTQVLSRIVAQFDGSPPQGTAMGDSGDVVSALSMESSTPAADAADSSRTAREQANSGGMSDSQFAEAVRRSSANRRLFVTEKGYMGIGERDVEPDDEVCVLFGGTVPFILRDTTDARGYETSKLVGACYVQGIMQGEFIGDHEARGTLKESSRWFIFC